MGGWCPFQGHCREYKNRSSPVWIKQDIGQDGGEALRRESVEEG